MLKMEQGEQGGGLVIEREENKASGAENQHYRRRVEHSEHF